MRTGRVCGVVTALLASALASPAVALAMKEAGHGEHHAPGIGDLFFPAINFAIYGFVIVKYLVPALREYLRRRRESLLVEVRDATASLTAAEQAVADAKKRAGALAAERDSIRADLATAASRQAERLLAQAEEGGRRRLADAAVVAEQERRRALQGVRGELADLAVALAEKRIREALSERDQHEFVRRFLKDAAATQ